VLNVTVPFRRWAELLGGAVDALAEGIARAVSGAGDAFRLSDQIVVMADRAIGLAAVRVLGADSLAPLVVPATRSRSMMWRSYGQR
jgi:hypothetical protein